MIEAETRLEIRADRGERTIKFDQRRGAVVAGRLLSPRGEPQTYGEIHVFRRQDEEWIRLPYKMAGLLEQRYTVRGLAPGRYRFAYTTEGSPVLGEVSVADRDVMLDLRFPR
jgi:hypothetical protein